MVLATALPFYKYSGCGNDFILCQECHIDAATLQPLVPLLCHRSEGIGGDGVLLLKHRGGVDAYVQIFNADGSEAEFCGNGLRCVTHHLAAEQNTSAPASYTLETVSGIYRAQLYPDRQVEINLGKSGPIIGPQRHPELLYPLYTLTVGVPHAVVICPELESIDVQKLGRQLRYSSLFAPSGVNVNFVKLLDNHHIIIRTYERGVEAETQACGSGAAAAAIVMAYHARLTTPLKLLTRHGAVLHYTFELTDRTAHRLTMRGPTVYCFCGTYQLPSQRVDNPTAFALDRAHYSHC